MPGHEPFSESFDEAGLVPVVAPQVVSGTAAPDLISVDEFYDLIADGQKADLLDGVIHMASPDSRSSSRRTNFLATLMEMFVAERDLGGEVHSNRFAYRLSNFRAPEPDVSYIAPHRLHLVRESGMQGGPDVAVEIVSRESRLRDFGEKLGIYQAAGVLEYWIIDPLECRAEFLRLRDGRYQAVPLEDGRIVRSLALPGFWLNVDWLLGATLPNAARCLREILKG